MKDKGPHERRRIGSYGAGRGFFFARPGLKALTLASLVFAVVLSPKIVYSGERKRYDTAYTSIYYASDEDFYDFAKAIGAVGIFGRASEKAIRDTKARIDEMVDRVEAILDMHPAGLRISVQIYGSHAALEEAYQSTGIIGAAPIAFYSHRYKSVFVSTDELREGVFAHELAHAVINFYFATPPPARMQEILAQFVDAHLWDDLNR